jgi:hypothetical protein
MSEFQDNGGPSLLKGNPGVGSRTRLAFANGEKSWTEEVDLLELMAVELEKQDFEVIRHETWLEHPASGFILLPQVVGVQPLERGNVRTASTIQIHHPVLVPGGVFEYQHSAADTAVNSFRNGIDQWSRLDFVSLLESARSTPGTCMTMVLSLPEKDGKPPRTRRGVFGPVAHYRTKPSATGDESESKPDEHSFCPCCLLTRSFPAFQSMVEGEDFFALRLFAARDENGQPQADCRVNGEDWEPGAEALREYATTWPAAGYEFRKQYVILQTIDNPENQPL